MAAAWEARWMVVLLHNGKKVRVWAEKKPKNELYGGSLQIGESRFYSVAAVLDPKNTEGL